MILATFTDPDFLALAALFLSHTGIGILAYTIGRTR